MASIWTWLTAWWRLAAGVRWWGGEPSTASFLPLCRLLVASRVIAASYPTRCLHRYAGQERGPQALLSQIHA